MSAWNEYPSNYRHVEVRQILGAVCAGNCVAVIGLSGSGKSNLFGFLAHQVRPAGPCPEWALIDCNRLVHSDLAEFYRLLLHTLDPKSVKTAPSQPHPREIFGMLEQALDRRMAGEGSLCLLLDRFDALFQNESFGAITGSLRSLRDQHKYRLTFAAASRKMMPGENELAELFYGHVIGLGPLTRNDAMWSALRDSVRYSLASFGEPREWSEEVLVRLVELSGGYPSLLRAACEAYAGGAKLESEALRAHPAVQRRLAEFWSDRPDPYDLDRCKIREIPWLSVNSPAPEEIVQDRDAFLTAKEARLLEYLRQNPGKVCEKEDLVQAVWPEDVIFAVGVRDESLAQLIRRLRVKIEPDPSRPERIQTIPGRGYVFKP